MGIDAGQLRDLITRVLQEMGLYSPAATELLMLTAATESHLGTYLRQLGGGPALGVFQMEPATHDDAWINWMPYHVKISMQASNVSQSAAIRRQRLIKGSMPDGNATELEWNLAYAVFMARVHYRRFPEPLPPWWDMEGLARYWKRYWNTREGAGTAWRAVADYQRLALPTGVAYA